jgi:valyl-tRNA synthetase
VWYPVTAEGETDHDHPILAPESALPVDPQIDVPEGYDEAQRGRAGGFVADPDIMDTWATSSLSPQIAAGWPVADGSGLGSDAALFDAIFPMDMRPQAHDIIRTWLFATVVRAHHEHGTVPWRNAAVSGWILDPDRKKMSKSKGNAETPEDVVKAHGADSVRYWAASGRLGTDAAYDTGQMKVGRRLAIKVLNASKFALGFGDVSGDLKAAVTNPLDLAMLAALGDVIDKATTGFESWDYTRSLEVTESFFWTFCDDYLELVKDRAYGGRGEAEAASARAALRIALEALLRLLAPFIPYATEEVWSWFDTGSVHRQPWPEREELVDGGDPALLTSVGEALAGVRKVKSEAKLGMRAEVRTMTLVGLPQQLGHVRAAEGDLKACGRIGELDYAEGDGIEVREAELIPVEKKQPN